MRVNPRVQWSLQLTLEPLMFQPAFSNIYITKCLRFKYKARIRKEMVICFFLPEVFLSESLATVHDVHGLHIADAYFKQYSGTIFLRCRC